MRRQDQSAGDHSQQLQAAGDINVYGVSASDVVEITRVEVHRVLDELTLTAESVAKARAEGFERRVLEQFEQNEQLRSAFADPDFQFSLRDAGRAAVSNEDKHTEDLLVDLLTNRAEQGNQSRVRLATSHAIRAADKLSLDALNGLTALWALSNLNSVERGVENELVARAAVASHLIQMGLPTDNLWVEDADALNLIGVHPSTTSRKRYKDFFQEHVVADLVPGVESTRLLGLLDEAQLAELNHLIRPHPLKPGFVALVGDTREDFLSSVPNELRERPEVGQLAADHGFRARDPAAIEEFVSRMNRSSALKAVEAWWDSVPPARFTVVGKVIGFVNARRYIPFQGTRTVADLLSAGGRAEGA